MRITLEIDDDLVAEAQQLSGCSSKKATVEEALRLMVRLRRQREVDKAFGRYRWRAGNGRRATRVARPQR